MRHSGSTTRRLAVAGVALGLALSGCGGDSTSKPASASGSTVKLKLLQFSPATLTVDAGTTVEFVNDESITHTVTTGTYTAGADKFRSAEMADGKLDKTLKGKGDKVSYTFDTPGTYMYFCTLHKAMHGQVVVR